MSVEITKDGQVVRASLSGDLTPLDASAFYRQLMAELVTDGTLVIDPRQLTSMDASMAQIVLLASRRVREFRIEGDSEEWDRTVTLLGLSFATPWTPTTGSAA